ncbi:MAG: hypothetical protein IKB93_00915, partial [Clostridia bacterium]|nr:hypothetical protein [Clostridia bacterium]
MTNKLTSKLVSVFLTVAICITTVFGCLVSVSAENSPSYVITGAQCVQGDTLASAIVEFNVPAGVAAGVFTIDNTDNWYSSVEVSLYGELAVSTDSVSISDDNGNVEFTIIDENGTAKAYTSIAFKLDFVFAAPIEDDIEITISDVDLNGIYATENYTTFVNASTSAFFTAGCQHKFVATGEVVYTSTDPEYTVYRSAKCSQCGEEKSDYQVVPTVQNDEGIVELWDGKDENGKWIGYQYSTFSGGTGAKDNPYIIKYSEQLAYLTTSSATTYESTAGKYYKVDDSIKAFNMNTTGLDLSGNMTAQEVYDALNDETVNRVYWAMAVFAGNFDGNGVEIYGLHTGHMKYVESGVDKTTDQTAGLFPKVAEGAVIKNITLKNSYMYTASTSGYAGGIIGGIFANAANYGSTADTVYIENCTVYDCYVGSKNITNAPGVLVGFAGTVAFLNISNTLVYDNEVANAKNAIKSIVGNASKWAYVDEAQTTKGTNNRVIDSVILGSTPYDANGSWWFNACDHKVYQNVYFDNTIDTSGFGNYGNANSKLTQLASVDNAKGSAAITNMLDLDWNTNENPDGIWFAGNAGQYPTLLKAPKAAVADSSDFGWKLLGVNLTYKNNGSFAINFHYLPKYDADVALYVTNANENTNTKVLTNPTDSSFAGTSLPAGAKMFTLDNLSARDISVLWLATIVTTSADETSVVYSETKQISIGNYAEDVVLGNAFYDQNASDADKAADKTVAAALINYGMASDGALAINKVESSSTATIVEKWDAYENGKYVGWYNANISGEGTKESPFIIDTAEKLAQLCRYGC